MSSYTGPTLHTVFYFRLTDATRGALADLQSARPAVKLLHGFASRAIDDAEMFSRFKVRTGGVIRRHEHMSRLTACEHCTKSDPKSSRAASQLYGCCTCSLRPTLPFLPQEE